MTQPDDMRIGDAERDAVTSALHEHFAAGRLDREELDERLDATLASKTQGDLKAIVQDLPGSNGLPEPAPKTKHRHRHPHHAHHQGMPMRHHRPGASPAFPLLLIVFTVVAFTGGFGAAVLAVLKVALLIFLVRAVVRAAQAARFHSR
ncbi:hypothetical protein Acsp03_20610 [Actinomadura sp. NBRC 104412]|uniref:DUF1707 SHOCT-like domain-containing protein n=1 Tax=Actinomadura sp. NBRC 104412 TaxID=3032203 RepID=UPI0024A371E8|nr:DUF1707 domain-containing protein [Actinomadura sp. NBRC 104412]GLZ04595.1 hypothetical protein Acsp03_20610 [Actinomadura sp. NBRC 104412]